MELEQDEGQSKIDLTKDKIMRVLKNMPNWKGCRYKDEKGWELLVHTVRIFTDDIGMEFGIDKYATLVLKRGKITKLDGVPLPDRRITRGLIKGAVYKYLGILQTDQIRYTEMRDR